MVGVGDRKVVVCILILLMFDLQLGKPQQQVFPVGEGAVFECMGSHFRIGRAKKPRAKELLQQCPHPVMSTVPCIERHVLGIPFGRFQRDLSFDPAALADNGVIITLEKSVSTHFYYLHAKRF